MALSFLSQVYLSQGISAMTKLAAMTIVQQKQTEIEKLNITRVLVVSMHITIWLGVSTVYRTADAH